MSIPPRGKCVSILDFVYLTYCIISFKFRCIAGIIYRLVSYAIYSFVAVHISCLVNIISENDDASLDSAIIVSQN